MTLCGCLNSVLEAPLRWTIYPLVTALVAATLLTAPSSRDDLPSDTELVAASRRLAEDQEAVAARITYKEAVVRDLVAGHVGLREVAERFHEVNATSEDCVKSLRLQYPGRTDFECSVLNVASFVRYDELTAGDARGLKARLDRELGELVSEGAAN